MYHMLYVHILLVCLSVCFQQLYVKTGAPIWPKFFAATHITPGKVMDGKNCKMLKTVNNCSMLTVNALGFNLNALTHKWFSVALYMHI